MSEKARKKNSSATTTVKHAKKAKTRKLAGSELSMSGRATAGKTLRYSVNKEHWTVPRGGSIHEVTRDAAGQVIVNYGEALRKLQKH